MTKTASNKISSSISNMGDTLKSIIKIILKSHRTTISKRANCNDSIIIMGNGPSLNDTISQHNTTLKTTSTLAVNFAANAPQFKELKPQYYVLADPHFFTATDNSNVIKLQSNLSQVDWAMTLFIPFEAKKSKFNINNNNIKIEYFNFIAAEGFDWFENIAYTTGRGMPRPRNVLIPAIMIAIKMGYGNIFITGADHSWTKTLSVNDNNEVISIQPHFYTEDKDEEKRIRIDYLNYPLHQIIYSFYIAFKSYHKIQRYALANNINIYNATPNSFIDAFPRKMLD